ncbi:DUF2169 family type VI secretion system accessory protein [Nitrosospira briensis]|uniref:DUF2169 family type VI secretion system accessory protein n=1 Tax=Nitrosospira briensis TaxID=35799 RepID=UPI0008E4B6F0|nr:DUF2169 domain-containing protein [Nitrosospira briensis]SFO42580.1 hypothetical protein SAMN05216332_11622 [Nitrosospira briensis]
MDFINTTRMVATYTMAFDASGRELMVVAIKGTFHIPDQPGAALRLYELQRPLTMSDEFFGEPGFSAPKYESDFAARKHHCDVLLNATAHAPGGRPTTRTTVGVQIGSWSKCFDVVGDRHWECGVGIRQSAPAAFTEIPITYDRAFGGTDNKHPDPSRHAAFMPNPVGRGFHKQTERKYIDGAPLPNTEESRNHVTGLEGNYRPMSFGPLGRHWQPRVAYAGTYDQKWIDEVCPFLPADFDERYFQAAPPDQQLPKFTGEQQVTLTNLTPGGRCDFVLPHFEAPVYVFTRRWQRQDLVAELDTILIEPDEGTVALTWRLTLPLQRDIFDLSQVLVGKKDIRWWRVHAGLGNPIPIHAAPTERDAAPQP